MFVKSLYLQHSACSGAIVVLFIKGSDIFIDVAMGDLVHGVADFISPLLTANNICKSFLNYSDQCQGN